MIGLLEITLAAGAVAAALTTSVTALVRPRPAPPAVGPARRSARARMWLYAPIWVTALLLSAALLRGPIALVAGVGDHCTAEDHHQHHLCLLHPPHASGRASAWLVTLAVVLPALALAARALRANRREARLEQTLVRSSQPSTLGPDVRILDQTEPLALTVGGLRPVVLVSRGLMDVLSPEALEAVLAHERAHAARRDPLRARIDRVVAAWLPRRVRRALIADLALAREQACDEAAAGRCGRLRVAATLTEVARLGVAAPAVGTSITSSPLEARVHALLAPPPSASAWSLGALATTLGVAALGLGPVHELLERAVALLLH